MTAKISSELPKARTPDEVGVSTQKMSEMLNELIETDCHGFMVIRHGKIAAQWFKKPHTAVTPHAMYSVSKSITSLAIGFAVCEGLISLSDRVVDYFPEAVPKNCDDDLKKVTLSHLISLTAGRNISPLTSKVKNDWIDIFMKSKRSYSPGESFSYVNECFHMALAMLRKVTGMSTVEFLTPRLFEPLGIPVPFWESDRNGVEAGGWGIVLSVTDLAKIALCYMNNGVYDNKQIIPPEWLRQSKTNHKGPKATVQNNQDFGYGYGLWISQGENPPVRFDGLFGQVAEMYEKYDALTITIGGDINAAHRNIMKRYFPESFIDEAVNAAKNTACTELFEESEYKPLFSEYRSTLESSINNRTIVFRKQHLLNLIDFPVSVLPAVSTYMSKYKAGNITDVRFIFSADAVRFLWREGNEKNHIDCGLNGKCIASKMTLTGAPFTAFSSAAWVDRNTLKLNIRPLECVCARSLCFTFSGNRVKMKPDSEPPVDAILSGLRGILRSFVKSERVVDGILNWGKKHIEPVHKGHFLSVRGGK